MSHAMQISAAACAFVVLLMLVGIAGAAIDVLKSIAAHRNAQASSVLKHAGLLDLGDVDE